MLRFPFGEGWIVAKEGVADLVVVGASTIGGWASHFARRGGLGRWSIEFCRRQHEELGTDSGFRGSGT